MAGDRRRGDRARAASGRPRVKFTSVQDMLAVARQRTPGRGRGYGVRSSQPGTDSGERGAGPRREPTVEPACRAVLLEDVGTPACGPRTGEHRRHHRGWHLGEVEDDRGPELDIGLDGSPGRRSRSSVSAAFSTAAATSVAGASRRLAVARSTRARGSLGPVDPVAEPHQSFFAVMIPRITAPASPVRSASWIIGITRAGAPPCSGPLIAPTAPDSAAATSAPVEAITER